MDTRKGPRNTEKADSGSMASSCIGTLKEVVQRYNSCVLCGSNLHFSHLTDFARNITQETTRCPECGNRGQVVEHILQ